ncbi:MAG: hypothetical protein ACLPYZ_10870 [Limisphaerales bacterium]
MSEPINQPAPRYVVCNCQHCDGHIEFDANKFAEENNLVPCPHCGMETKIFIPTAQTEILTAQQPSAIATANAGRREGFFCGDIAIEETIISRVEHLPYDCGDARQRPIMETPGDKPVKTDQAAKDSGIVMAKCLCQGCRKPIKFDETKLTDENCVVSCPHCGWKTTLFKPVIFKPTNLTNITLAPVIIDAVGNHKMYVHQLCEMGAVGLQIDHDRKEVTAIEYAYIPMLECTRIDRVNHCMFEVPEGFYCWYIRHAEIKSRFNECRWFMVENGQMKILGEMSSLGCHDLLWHVFPDWSNYKVNTKREKWYRGSPLKDGRAGVSDEPLPAHFVAANKNTIAPICELKVKPPPKMLSNVDSEQNEKPQVLTEGQLNKLWRKSNKLKEAINKSRSQWMDEGERVTLTSAQCEIPIVQELIALLVEIEKDGFITDHGARRLANWLEPKFDSEIPAFYFLLDTSRLVLSNGELTTKTIPEMMIALELQTAIERVLPKHIREPIVAKRLEVEGQLRSNAPVSQGVYDYIRLLGGKPSRDITAEAAYRLKEELYHQPTEKQIEYIRALGVNPPSGLTRFTAIELIDKLLHSVKATEGQLQYIRDLGGNPSADLTHAAAAETIKQLLARQQPTPRQMMILRFWNKTDLMQSSKEDVTTWLEQFYSEDPRRKAAWEAFKLENGDDGSQRDPSWVPIGVGESYLSKCGSNQLKPE